MSRRTYRIIEGIIITAMLLGIAAMFQPWEIELYHLGFLTVLFSTLLFIIISHIPMPVED